MTQERLDDLVGQLGKCSALYDAALLYLGGATLANDQQTQQLFRECISNAVDKLRECADGYHAIAKQLLAREVIQ